MDLATICLIVNLSCLGIQILLLFNLIPSWLEDWVVGLSTHKVILMAIGVSLLAPISLIFLLVAYLIDRFSKKETDS